MFKIESYFGPILMSYLNKYVKLEEESFKLSLWGGDVTFHNLELQYDILEDLMPLPIGFKSGQVHELKVHVPWTKLGSESVVITLNTVECIIALKSDFVQKSKGSDLKEDSSNIVQKQKLEKSVPPGYLKSYLVNIINNIHVKVNNLIIKFVEDDIVLSMNAKSLEYLPVTNNWSQGFIDFSSGNLLVHKIVKVSDLTICLDQMDVNGHIDVYQEPILYRCSVECRFILRYQSVTSNKPIFLKFNIKFGNLELNVTIGQISMMRRLTELFYALYYNTINWDAVVGCGFTKQIKKTTEKCKDSNKDIPSESDSLTEDIGETSWGSWAWSYVPSVFSYEEGQIEEDSLEDETNQEMYNKKILIFGIYFDSLQVNLKKSLTIKSHYGTHRSGRSQKTILFLALKGNNIGLNLTSNGLGFFNVQLGCTDFYADNSSGICPCGQLYKVDNDNKISEGNTGNNQLFHLGTPSTNLDTINDFYLTGSLFSVCEDKDNVTNTLNKLNNICSQETYAALYSREQCLEAFGAIWFDYVYCMQIVNNDMQESQIDISNLCNTDGIRESSIINLYVGSSVSNINSYFVHNLVEVTKALDISKYSSYFKTSINDERRSKVLYPTEDQVARIHEFIPIRQYNISITNWTIIIQTFLESHNAASVTPMIELKGELIKFSKSIPMYPIHLIDCISVISTNLLKESKELLNKCYLSKAIEVSGLSMSLVAHSHHELAGDISEYINSIKSEIISPCSIGVVHRTLLYPESWKASQFVNNENIINISKIKLSMVPSHLKTVFLICASNYSWIAIYFQFHQFSPNLSSMNRQLDDITMKLIDPQGSLIESCFQSNYHDKTYELCLHLPTAAIKLWKTNLSYFIDATINQDILFAYLKDPISMKIIPVLDNKAHDYPSKATSLQTPFCLLYCQMPIQTRPINCAFSFHCQVGSLNCMFSSQLINWLTFPILDFDLDECPRPQSVTTSSRSRESMTLSGVKLVSDTRSTADGNSRPQSPTILFNKYPVPGHPRSISNIDSLPKSEKVQFLSNKSGWWNMFKEGCSKYFFFLQSLDVCIKMRKSKVFIITVTDSQALLANVHSCNEWVEQFENNDQCSIFVITMTRLALINSQRKEYLDDNFERNSFHGSKFQQTKSTVFMESLPWELIFHDIKVDCVHSITLVPGKFHTVLDSILKPVSINCTLSASPKCSSPERLDTLYSISWGVHVDITEVQPTVMQIYLTKLLDFFVYICLRLSGTEFREKHYQLLTSHYSVVKNHNNITVVKEEATGFQSKQSISTKSTLKSTSRSSTAEHKITSSSYRVLGSKLETQSVTDNDVGFKLSFWVQCTLSQFQFIILLNDNENGDSVDSHMCLIMQIDDVTGSLDVQEKFVEIKWKFGSIFCQLGVMKDDEIISETPILKSGSKFLSNTSFNNKLKDEHMDDMPPDNGNRHCLSAALIRTTVNNLSQRPLSTYHQIQDTDSFKSYPTEFTGNFSTAPNSGSSNQNYVTQISSIIEPFELIISSNVIEQCHKLTDTLISIYLRFFHSINLTYRHSKKVKVSSAKLEPYFISEDLPKFYLLIKSSRIIMPCSNKKSIRKESDSECIVLSWNKISLQPFSDNPIARPPVKLDSSDEDSFNTKCESTLNSIESEQKPMNSLDDNRQFQLNINNLGLYFSLYNTYSEMKLQNRMTYDVTLPKSNRYVDMLSTSVLHGQNPAFEWNNYSKMSTSFHSKKCADCQSKPILKPIDVQVNFAGALHQNCDSTVQRHLLAGYGLEINILTSVEFLLDNVTIDSVKSVLYNLNKLFSYENPHVPDRKFEEVDNEKVITSLDEWIKEYKLSHMIPCVPTNILITTRKIQIVIIIPEEPDRDRSPSAVHGLCLSISQPHLLIYFRDQYNNKFEMSLFDVTLMVTPTVWSQPMNFFDSREEHSNWTSNLEFILAEMRTILKTKSGSPDMKTGVPKSFCTLTFSDFYLTRDSKLKLDFSRRTLIDMELSDIEQLSMTIQNLQPQKAIVAAEEDGVISSSKLFPLSIILPRYFTMSAELVSVKFRDSRQFNCDFEVKFGRTGIKSNTVKNYTLNNLKSLLEFYCNSVLIVSSTNANTASGRKDETVILRPLKMSGKCQFRQYRSDCADEYWVSSEMFCDLNVGAVHLSVDKPQLFVLRSLLDSLDNSINTKKDCITPSRKMSNASKLDNRVEMFYDDLRSERFQIETKLNIDTALNESLRMVADDGTVMFSGDGEDLAAMYWTYPEARFISAIEVKPVPFVFIEYKLNKEDNYENLQIPCELEYWSTSNNCYEVYKKFHLSENQVEKIDDFPTMEREAQSSQRLVVSKSWRVVFDCYARYMKVDKDNNISYSERAMLVYLSPLVLAASLKVDSCYAPCAVKNSYISVSSQLIQLEYRDTEIDLHRNEDLYRPFKSRNACYGDYSIADHSTLFTIGWHNFSCQYALVGEVRSHISKTVLQIAAPFLALKTSMFVVDDIKLSASMDIRPDEESNVSLDIGAIRACLDEFSLRQLVIISEHLKDVVNQLLYKEIDNSVVYSQSLVLCNFLDRKIRLRQNKDRFYSFPETTKMGGIAPGEAVILKFLPANYSLYHRINTEMVPYDQIKLTLGLCSELKGTVRWTESMELPYLNYVDYASSVSNLNIWNVDCVDAPISSNSSNLSNSYNAKNLLLLHNQSISGLNKLILMGNAMFNNLTSDPVHVSFSLPSEISSGFSFSVPASTSNDLTTSIHINWKVVSLASPKTTFELSFRIGTGHSDNIEYRSQGYKMSVPKFINSSIKYYYQHSVIKLKEHRAETQIIKSEGQWRQILCTMEWFQLNKNEDIFLLMTLSPMVICRNMMLHNVKMHLNWISDNKDFVCKVNECVVLQSNGGILEIVNFHSNELVEVNASFINDSKLLFDKSLVLTETGLIESLDQNFRQSYYAQNQGLDHDLIRQHLSDRLVKIINKDVKEPVNQCSENPYSVLVTITPWILIKNSTTMDLFLGFDRNIYLLEALNDFVPPQYDKPVKIGIAHDNEIFWSKTFFIGDSILTQTDADTAPDLLWNIVDLGQGTESYLQITLVLAKARFVVPVTLRHIFARQSPTQSAVRPHLTNRYNSLIVESSVFVNNQTKIGLDVLPISLTTNIPNNLDYSVTLVSVGPQCTYVPLTRFMHLEDYDAVSDEPKWFLSLTKSGHVSDIDCISNFVSILDFRKLTNFRETDNTTYINFSYVEHQSKESEAIDFIGFIVNSTLDYRTHKIFTDVFECLTVPIKITNHSSVPILINQFEDYRNNINPTVSTVRPNQAVPYWPNNFVLDINKDGYSSWTNIPFRLRIGIELNNDIDWTDYFPLIAGEDISVIDVVTTKSRQHIFVRTESSAAAKLHIHIHERDPLINGACPQSHQYFTTTISIAKCLLSVFEICDNLESPSESIRLTVDNCSLQYSHNQTKANIRRAISISSIQLDNKRFDTGLYDFPVIMYSKSKGIESKCFVCIAETDSCGMHSLNLDCGQEIELFLENLLLYDLLRIFTKLSQSVMKKPEGMLAPLYSSAPLNIGTVRISSVPLIITVHAFLKIYVSCEATSLSLPKFSCPSSLIRLKTIQRLLYEHYVTAALVRCGWVMGSFELLGNPSGIVHHLTMGLSNLLCSKNIDHGLLADFLLRLLSFCRYTTGGLVSSFTGIASSVSRNLDYLCLDNSHISRQDSFRRQYQPSGVIHGFVQGLSGFAISLLGAIAGLADHPLRDSQEALVNNSSVTIALLKGLGKGLVGVVTKPLSGTAELFAQTGRGLLKTTGITILRCHSPTETLELFSRTEIMIDERQVLKHLMPQQYGDDNASFMCLWTGIGTNYQQQLVYLFLTDNSLIVWSIDNPLGKKHNVYSLAEYNVTLCPLSASSSGHTIIRLHHVRHKDDQALNADFRINAFLSEQVCDTSSVPLTFGATMTYTSQSSASSAADSADFVSLPDHQTSNSRVADNGGAGESPPLLFTLNYSSDGLFNALTFLQLYRDSIAAANIV